jgi:hypothetical protein
MKQVAHAGIPGPEIIEPIERAVRDDRVTALASALAAMNSRGMLDDANFFPPALVGRYTRRLLWRDPLDRFVMVGMTWPAGFATPVHDHAGLWGAEAVVAGTMLESSYRAIESDEERGMRFDHAGDTMLKDGSVGILVPPLEYHSYRNVTDALAHTVHIYSGLLEECNSYTPSTGGWWTVERRTLHYDL